MASSEPIDALSASDLLRQAEGLLGSGGDGNTPMARLADAAAERAREAGDKQIEGLAQFYRLVGQVYQRPEAEMMASIDAAHAHCVALGAQPGCWTT